MLGVGEKEEDDNGVDEAWGDEGVECRPWESLLCDLVPGGDLGRRLTGSAATSRLLLTNLVSGPILKNELKHVLEQLKPKAQIPFLCFPQVNAGEAPVMPKEIGWK